MHLDQQFAGRAHGNRDIFQANIITCMVNDGLHCTSVPPSFRVFAPRAIALVYATAASNHKVMTLAERLDNSYLSHAPGLLQWRSRASSEQKRQRLLAYQKWQLLT